MWSPARHDPVQRPATGGLLGLLTRTFPGLLPCRRVEDQQQGQRELDFDYLVYALGSMTNLNNVPGVKDYAYSLQPRGPRSAVDLRERLAEARPLTARGRRVLSRMGARQARHENGSG